jgi:hypothetical protein
MFGMPSSAGAVGAVADMLVAIYNAADLGPHQQNDFIELTADIGVPWNKTNFEA